LKACELQDIKTCVGARLASPNALNFPGWTGKKVIYVLEEIARLPKSDLVQRTNPCVERGHNTSNTLGKIYHFC